MLIEAFRLPFMGIALVAMLLLAVASGPISTLVNLRGFEFMSDGLTHAIFPGIVIGFAAGSIPGLYVGAVVAAVVAAVVLTLISRRGVASDAAIAIVLTAAFGIGIIIVSRQNNYFGQLQQLLFGRLFTVPPAELVALAVTLGVAVLMVALTWRRQVFRAFDADGAAAARVRPLATDLVLTIAIALVVVAASNAVGNLLVLAVLIIPGAVGRLVSRRLGVVVVAAALFTGVASWLGLVAAFEISVSGQVRLPGGAAVVLTMVVGYLVVAGVRLGIDLVGRRRVEAVV